MGTNLCCISDSEDFQPVAPVVKVEPLKNQWADEDVDADDVKDSWEEEEEEEVKMKTYDLLIGAQILLFNFGSLSM
jgi:hypothetical protein